MLVMDASGAVDLVARLPRGRGVQRRVAGQQLVAPELLDVEVLSALARFERAGDLAGTEADAAVSGFRRLPVERVSHRILVSDTWTLRHQLRTADAFYVACARLLDAPLLTTDARLARARVPGVSVVLVS